MEATIRNLTNNLMNPLSVMALLEDEGWEFVWWYPDGDQPAHLMAATGPKTSCMVSPEIDSRLWAAWKDIAREVFQYLVPEGDHPGGYIRVHGTTKPASADTLRAELVAALEPLTK